MIAAGQSESSFSMNASFSKKLSQCFNAILVPVTISLGLGILFARIFEDHETVWQ
jgi:hypothetical protein